MPDLAGIVSRVHAHADDHAESSGQHSSPASPTNPKPNGISLNGDPRAHPDRRISGTHSHKESVSLSPASRTGPPRSLSYNYSLPAARSGSRYEIGDLHGEPRRQSTTETEGDPYSYDYEPHESQFRGALEYTDPEQREREREIAERKGKRRDASRWDEWRLKWIPESFTESPKDEQPQFDFGHKEGPRSEHDRTAPPSVKSQSHSRSASNPKDKGKEKEKDDDVTKSPNAKWNKLRFLLPHVAGQAHKEPLGSSTVVPAGVNITDELIAGGLSTLMLQLWFERDEKGHRRVPALLHRLRIRISDSLHPMQGSQSVFRIECEYANGAVRWVIYRQLRDFLSLHTHYAVSNAYNRNIETLPEFPRTSLPYFKFLKKEGREKGSEVGRSDFARLQREALENYLIGLTRAVSGGAQLKAGYLKIEASSSKGSGFGRKAAGRTQKKAQKWCAIRESYLVAVDEPGELSVWDVFMLDPDFKIERPMRYYRQGLNILQGDTTTVERVSDGPHENGADNRDPKDQGRRHSRSDDTTDRMSLLGSIRTSFSKVLHPHQAGRSSNGDARTSTSTRPRSDSQSSSSDSSTTPSRPPTPMLDPSTNTDPLAEGQGKNSKDSQQGQKKNKNSHEVSKHTFYVENSQMRLKLYAKSERQMLQWIAALEKVAATSHFTGGNRFDSFAPIRLNVAAQWLVDGRDYFWNLSRAILLARDSIYIHDWWLSPELLLRRPGKPKYRLDHLLERKAKEGVKIHIILYQEVSSRTTPTDSNYTKQTLVNLHPNIMIQRSPSHFQTGTFYWAHHEKLCVIDQTIAFMGGLDLSFGRWDTSQHALVDDPDEGTEQIWPGKDFSNGRITDFYNLSKPDEDMHDRSRVPRMPWHDVGMQVVGQPARDLARHFVQRWNYLLRIKNHSRFMPFLLPPPEFRSGELEQLGLSGTCEMQICRSAGPWSLGTPDRIEHSIQNAYLKAIQMSEHFVYIENQFFITSTVVDDVPVENKIGDAIVHRIIRAHREGTQWKCCVVIPLLPGFPFPVDHNDASSVRIILECQNRTICRGPNSIFARLRKEGIDPDEYFSVFSLRNWGKLRGDVLTTELVYIHGKVCIVDDRLAIIGSANINERSQRGDRDSELAAVIRDTDMIDGTMAGKPFKVGRFAHTLRVRLMREHIGIDVDALDEEDLLKQEPVKEAHQQEEWDPDSEQRHGDEDVIEVRHPHESRTRNLLQTGTDGAWQVLHGSGDVGSKNLSQGLHKLGLKRDVPNARAADKTLEEERQTFTHEGEKVPGFTSSVVPTLEEKIVAEHFPPTDRTYGTPTKESLKEEEQEKSGLAPPEARLANEQLYGAPADAAPSVQEDDQPPEAKAGKSDADREEQQAPRARSILRKHLLAPGGQGPWTLPTPKPKVVAEGFEDPVCDEFWKNVWVAAAVHNTEIFRRVFHAIPDDIVTTWKQYIEFVAHHERLNKPIIDDPASQPTGRVPSETGDEDAPGEQAQGQGQEPRAEEFVSKATLGKAKARGEGPHGEDEDTELHGNQAPVTGTEANVAGSQGQSEKVQPEKTSNEKTQNDKTQNEKIQSEKTQSEKGKKSKGEMPFSKKEKEEMEVLLGELCGHLVIYPTRFLEGEDIANNFLFNADRLMPLPIYD
ncbi:hypothetical protein EVG20_g164 [Dentipellis fragilis]|uniref:Phospholipase n=1 Tax=Dentipellis fragilis TaxID=205917 RepID=A0A4Y9ZFN6_9AGAM|nr:hypothetical protein EVG20_g164 [Dentipellis fragilis]